MNRKLVSIIAAIVIIAISFGLMGFFSSLKKEPAKIPPKEVIINVKAQAIKYETMRAHVYGTGRVSSFQTIDLISEVQGRILEGSVLLKKGENFEKGDLLVRIFNDDAAFTLQSRKSKFLNAIALILPDFKIDFPGSYDKWNDFFKQISTGKDLPELPQITDSQEKIYLSSKNILSEYYGIKSDEIRLKKYNLYAPFSGSIGDVNLELGSVANPGSKIARLIKTNDLELEVPLEIEDAVWVKVNDNVKVVDTKTNVEWMGKVVRKANYVDEKTQSIAIFVGINSTDEKPIFKGQYLQAHFEGKELKNVMEMPRNAVVNNNQVFVVVDSLLTRKHIDIQKVNTKTLFFTGIEEGTELVVEPLLNVTENTKVHIIR